MKSSRPYVQPDPAVIEQARQMDLLSYDNKNDFLTIRLII